MTKKNLWGSNNRKLCRLITFNDCFRKAGIIRKKIMKLGIKIRDNLLASICFIYLLHRLLHPLLQITVKLHNQLTKISDQLERTKKIVAGIRIENNQVNSFANPGLSFRNFAEVLTQNF